LESNVSQRKADKILILLGILLFFNGLGGGVAFPIIPLIGPAIGVSAFLVSMILSANRIARFFFNGIAGEIVDRYGCKKPLIIGTLIKAVGVTGYSLALFSSVMPGAIFFASRFFYGIGSAFGFITVYGLMFHLTDKANRGSRTAYIRTAGLFGFPAGLFSGGVIANYFGFHAAFLIAASFLYFITITAYFVIPEMDLAHKKTTIGPLEAIKLAASDKRVLRISMVNFLEWFTINGVFLATTALFVQEHELYILNLGADGMSGFMMAAMMFSKGLSTLMLGNIIDGAETRSRFSIVGGIFGCFAFLTWALFPSLISILLSLLLLGVCSGIMSSPLLTLLGDVSKVNLRGRTLGIYQIFGDMGGALGPIFGINAAGLLGFNVTFTVVALMLMATLIFIIPLYKEELAQLKTQK